jgi:hypothetical protein
VEFHWIIFQTIDFSGKISIFLNFNFFFTWRVKLLNWKNKREDKREKNLFSTLQMRKPKKVKGEGDAECFSFFLEEEEEE